MDDIASLLAPSPAQLGPSRRVTIRAEKTHFRLPPNAFGFVARHAQGECHRTALAEFTGETERPFTIELADGRFLAIAEARLVDYARMRLATELTYEQLSSVSTAHRTYRVHTRLETSKHLQIQIPGNTP